MTQDHIPVMLDEVVSAMAPRDGETYIDATFGAGGYASALLEAADCHVIGFDRDPRSIKAAAALQDKYQGRLTLIEAPFAQMQDALAAQSISAVHGVMFDLGVSSMQLDKADRGFSFLRDGPLSMRMDGGQPDARNVVNEGSADDLRLIFRIFGEEKNASHLAKAVVAARGTKPIETTAQLAAIIEAASPSRFTGKKGRTIHPATRVFQAIRLFVNDELGQLARALCAVERLLAEGGRLVAVSFHSLEARIVKRFLADRSGIAQSTSRHKPLAQAKPSLFDRRLTQQVKPSDDEEARNPRARSALLRRGVRTSQRAETEMHADDLKFAGLPMLDLSKPLCVFPAAHGGMPVPFTPGV